MQFLTTHSLVTGMLPSGTDCLNLLCASSVNCFKNQFDTHCVLFHDVKMYLKITQ